MSLKVGDSVFYNLPAKRSMFKVDYVYADGKVYLKGAGSVDHVKQKDCQKVPEIGSFVLYRAIGFGWMFARVIETFDNGSLKVDLGPHGGLLAHATEWHNPTESTSEVPKTKGEKPKPEKQIEEWFSYHPPKAGQPQRYEAIRDAAKTFALVLEAVCPDSADKTAAMRKLRECVMTANAAIALEGKL